jgi:hypothetical protein
MGRKGRQGAGRKDGALAIRCGSAVRIRFEDALVPQRRQRLDLEGKDDRIPPHDGCATRRPHVQTGSD